MKAIQYREDGKFYGLYKPEEPTIRPVSSRLSNSHERAKYDLIEDKYEREFKNSLAAGKEIINPEVFHRSIKLPSTFIEGVAVHAITYKPGDIFDVTDDVEFESGYYCSRNKRDCHQGCIICPGDCIEVIRLKLKQEVKPVESQYDLWAEAVYICMMSGNINELKSKFTIQRNKI